ncbi:sugar phosphate isomerase/epimerase [Flavobacteriaceae bacterium F89]|uniref:Sugar phosphate isomerase/epimerase n=1 Tax=Cerina litoralis TaxID=2874477 RepID=A0AAE3JNR7_9FLAO|nr:sugar phosphate isomerase/epimerase [Cerina litoralis]MCG2460079.1 sugar phosphate isomerase/epimerase [Cerina litoralis]
MSNKKISRRKAIQNSMLASVSVLGGQALMASAPSSNSVNKREEKKKLPFGISLNTSTLIAYKLPVDQQIAMIAKTGFDGTELWMRDVKSFLQNGGSSSELREKLESGHVVLENMIAFSKWCSDDAEERKAALDLMHEEMSITANLGGKFIAAPVQGVKSWDCRNFDEYADRYNAILKLGDGTGVTPLIELWGAGTLNKLGDCAQIVIATGNPNAAMLLDFYHLYRGGNSWDTLDCINGKKLPVIHMNDYPASPAREQLTDADRVLPGKGVCPYDKILPKLYDAGFRGALSVELFNKGYWASMDATTMLKESYDTTYQVISSSMEDYL